MKKIGLIAILSFLTVATLATPVFASGGSPHFIGSPTIAKSLTSGLSVSWKAAGLDDTGVSANLSASSVEANYVCVNHGGNIAPGQPLVFSAVVGPTVNLMPHNGQITFTVTIPAPPTPDPASVCPNGNWSVRLLSLTFFDVTVHIFQNGSEVLTGPLGTIDP